MASAPHPVGQQACLAEPSRGANQDQPALHPRIEGLHQPRSWHETWLRAGHMQFGGQQNIALGSCNPSRGRRRMLSHQRPTAHRVQRWPASPGADFQGGPERRDVAGLCPPPLHAHRRAPPTFADLLRDRIRPEMAAGCQRLPQPSVDAVIITGKLAAAMGSRRCALIGMAPGGTIALGRMLRKIPPASAPLPQRVHGADRTGHFGHFRGRVYQPRVRVNLAGDWRVTCGWRCAPACQGTVRRWPSGCGAAARSVTPGGGRPGRRLPPRRRWRLGGRAGY